MRGAALSLVPVFALLALAWVILPMVQAAPPASIAPATLIAKPAAGGPIARYLDEVLAGKAFSPEAVAGWLAPMAAAVEAPLAAVRATSGGELVVEVPRDEALAQAAARLRVRDGVARVEVVPDESGSTFYVEDRLLIEPSPASDLAQALKSRGTAPSAEQLQGLADALLAGSPYQGKALIRPDGHLAILIDWAGTAERIAERLRRRDDIDYVQVERLLGPLGPLGR